MQMRPAVVLVIATILAVGAGFVAGAVSGGIAGVWTARQAQDSGTGLAADGSDATDDDVPNERAHPGDTVRLRLPPPEGEIHVRVDIPPDAVAVRLSAASDDVDLHLRLRCADADGAAAWIADTAWDHEAENTARAPTLDVAEFGVAFEPGEAEVCVESVRVLEDDEDARAELRIDVVRASVDATLETGDEPASWEGETTPESGFRRTFEVRPRDGAEALRLDVADAESDLDVYVSHEGPFVRTRDAVTSSSSPGRTEWLVLSDDDLPAEPGAPVFVTVVDPSTHRFPVKFRLVVTEGTDPPEELRGVRPILAPADPKARALAAVVEVLTDGGTGSGTIVSEDGLVLTAYHVVEAAARAVAGGNPDAAGRIVVAVTLDPAQLAEDLFEAEVVHADDGLDLAMLRIVRTVRGRPLPPGTRFSAPPVRTAFPRPALGDALWTVGYPAAGGVGTRVPQTVARGVVSGWNRSLRCDEMKTDAFVAPGSSGGAAFDDAWRLVAVPVSTMDGGNVGTVLGSLVPVWAVPADWWK